MVILKIIIMREGIEFYKNMNKTKTCLNCKKIFDNNKVTLIKADCQRCLQYCDECRIKINASHTVEAEKVREKFGVVKESDYQKNRVKTCCEIQLKKDLKLREVENDQEGIKVLQSFLEEISDLRHQEKVC